MGALISGVAGYFLAQGNHRHEFRKERWRRQQDSLESISGILEQVHAVFLINCSFRLPIKVSTVTIGEVYKERFKNTGDAFIQLHQLEGRLLLLGLSEASHQLRKYRLKATEIEEMALLPVTEDIEEIKSKIMTELCDEKVRLYSLMGKAYVRA